MFPLCFLNKKIIKNIKSKFFTTANIFKSHENFNKENKSVIDVYENYEVLKNIKKKNTLKNSLKKFREIVQKETKRKGYNFYYGWPPINRIKITEDEKLGLYGRKVFIFNRIKGIKEKEANLCICCKNKNIIFLNKQEFQSLLNNINFIKQELQEFAKKI
ncbi:conserved Plasmodium protein, unknown function [Plasmodium relictum]|uniref:Uncharacterized protein n=1 Tax=Plasmodium relictum TaxID=85471 RepID=A0A1J1H9V6_PLARL|nr:conserved Plasmodium protein, unknown function [Plasmodium relictum]CRH01725.1 conserved Plasmodium protein, unknown function [Plasmodium relictum]